MVSAEVCALYMAQALRPYIEGNGAAGAEKRPADHRKDLTGDVFQVETDEKDPESSNKDPAGRVFQSESDEKDPEDEKKQSESGTFRALSH